MCPQIVYSRGKLNLIILRHSLMTRAYYKRWSLFYSLIRALNNFQTFNKNKPFMQNKLVVLACRGVGRDFGRKK